MPITPRARGRSARPSRDRNTHIRVKAVADALEQEIIFGNLHPRERLIEDELCARFGLKRHVARQALAVLEGRGLVVRKKNFSCLVKSYTEQEVVDLCVTRQILETGAAQLIMLPVASNRLEALVTIQGRHDDAVKRADLRGVYLTNIQFHKEIFALCGNKVLEAAIGEYARRALAIRFSSFSFPEYLEKARIEHHQMIDAIRTSDKARLVSLCGEHLVPARTAYLSSYHRQLHSVVL